MIRKFLMVAKTLTLSSTKHDDEPPGSQTVELLMPIDVYWEIADLLGRADYLLASNEQMVDVQDIYRRIYHKAAPYSVQESNRNWLHERSMGSRKQATK